MISVLEHRLDVSTYQCKENWGSSAQWNQVEESGLRVFVKMHYSNGQAKAGNVSQESDPKVEIGVPFQRLVITEEKSDENSRNDNVAKAKHGHVGCSQAMFDQVLGEY